MKNKSILFVIALFVTTAIGMIWHVKTLQTNIAQETAIQNAKLISIVVLELQKLYSDDKSANSKQAEQLKTNPHVIPETLTMTLGNQLAINAKTFLYSPYPFTWNKDTGGLNDDFRKEAWTYFATNSNQVYFKIYSAKHIQLLRYSIATKMEKNCINCHNNHNDSSKKDWASGDIGGVIEVSVPFKKIIPKENENLRLTMLVYSGLALCGLLGIIAMIIKQKHYNDELNRLTATDPLTGLFNQNELVTSLKRETEKVKRGGDPLCLMHFDIDGFKQINDTLGHLKGDELLRKIGEMLPALIRPFDIPCRFSGDEFSIILPGCTTAAAVQIGERIIENLQKQYHDVQLSIGIAHCATNTYIDPDGLIRLAIANKNFAKQSSDRKIKL